jgi:hypothetical protein
VCVDEKESQKIPDGIRLPGDPLSQDVQYPLEYSDLRLVWELPRKYRDKWAEMATEPLLGPHRHPSGKWRYPASYIWVFQLLIPIGS